MDAPQRTNANPSIMDCMTHIPTPDERPTLRVEEAGALLGLGRSASYNAANAGQIPTIRVGRRLLVPTAPFRRLLGIDEKVAA